MTISENLKKGGIQYIKYATIGLSCAIIDLGVLNGLLYLFPTSNNGWLAFYNTFAYGMAVLNSYIWNSRFTFKEHSEKGYKQFTAFIIQSIVALCIQDAILIGGTVFLRQVSSLPLWLIHNIAKLTSMFLSSVASFFFNKFFVFRRSNGQPQENA